MKRLAALALTLAIAAAGCSRSGTGPAGPAGKNGRLNAWTVPHVLRYATGEDFSTLNPLLNQQTTLSLMSSLTMAWLIKWNVHDRPYPELATEVPTKADGGVSKDGLTITYHLRKGVKWSDGAPFTADDVVWTIHAIMNPANNVTSRTGWDLIRKVDEPNKYTVVLHMSKPYSPFVENFFSTAGGNPCILPKHLLAKYPNINHVPYNSLPVGIGPFKYKEWDRGSRVVMVRNPLYWRGLPKLKEIDFEIIPDTNTVITQLEAKELDMFYNAPPAQIGQLRSLLPFTTYVMPDYYYRHLDFNLSSPKLKDRAVREALRYATDRPAIIAKIYKGIGSLQEQPSPKSAPYYDPSIKVVPFDIAKANQILDRAGWKRGPDGVREKNGVRLSLNVALDSADPQAASMMELIRAWWKQIGVRFDIRQYPSSLLFADYADHGIIYRGKFDVSYFQWSDDPLGDFSPIYACDGIPPNGQNDVRWCNRKADAAMHALYTHFTQRQRNADDRVVMRELYKDVPTIVVMGTDTVWVWNKDLKHFHPNAISPFDNMMNVDI